MSEALQTLFNILLIADKNKKTSKYFVVIFIFILLSTVSENDLPSYAFETSLELSQTESVRLTQFINGPQSLDISHKYGRGIKETKERTSWTQRTSY